MHKCTEHLGCSGENISLYSHDNELKFEQCNDCGIIWRSADSIHLTKPYEQSYFDSKNYSKHRKHKVKKSGWLIDLAKIHHPKLSNLLEVGCSLCHTLEAAKIRNINHLGIDISNYAVKFCKELGLNASVSFFEELKGNGKKYDLIFMQHVLEHFKNPFSTLNNCHELLNEQGLVLILVPNSNYKRAVKYNSKHRFYSMHGVGSEHFAYFNYSTLKKVLKATGFKIVQENYPVLTGQRNTFEFFINRIFRRSLSLFNSDQEILIIARKTGS